MRWIRTTWLLTAALLVASVPIFEAAAQSRPASGASQAEVLALANRFNGIIGELKRGLRERRTDVAGVNAVFGRQPIALHRATVGALRASLTAYPQTQEAHRAWVYAYSDAHRILATALVEVEYMLRPTKGQRGSFYPEIERLKAELTDFQIERAHYFAGGKANVLRLLAQAATGMEAYRTATALYQKISMSDWPADVQELVSRRQRTQMAAMDSAKAAKEAKDREEEYGVVPQPLRRLFLERRLRNEHALFHIWDRQYSRVAELNPFRTFGGTLFDASGRSDMNRHVRQHLHALRKTCPDQALAIGVQSMPDDDYFDLKGGRIVDVGLVTPSMQAAVADAQAYVSLMGCKSVAPWARSLKSYLNWDGR